MAWIKLESHTPDKVEIFQMAEILGIDCDAVVGKCVRVWAWFDLNTTDGVTTVTIKTLLDRLCNVTGMCDAMIKVGWMQEIENILELPYYDRHNSKTAKERALTAKRNVKYRESIANRDAKVTSEPSQNRHANRNIDKIREDKIREDYFISDSGKNDDLSEVDLNNNKLSFDHDRILANTKHPLIAAFYDAIRKYNKTHPVIESVIPATLAACENNLQRVKELCQKSKDDFQSLMERQIDFGKNPAKITRSTQPVQILSEIASYQVSYLEKKINDAAESENQPAAKYFLSSREKADVQYGLATLDPVTGRPVYKEVVK